MKSFLKIYNKVLGKHAPLRKLFVQDNHSVFMNGEL